MDINDVIVLTVNLPDQNLEKGSVGVIVGLFDAPEEAYEVEYCNESGETIVELALTPDQMVVSRPG